jgi:hypothetical protein
MSYDIVHALLPGHSTASATTIRIGGFEGGFHGGAASGTVISNGGKESSIRVASTGFLPLAELPAVSSYGMVARKTCSACPEATPNSPENRDHKRAGRIVVVDQGDFVKRWTFDLNLVFTIGLGTHRQGSLQIGWSLPTLNDPNHFCREDDEQRLIADCR